MITSIHSQEGIRSSGDQRIERVCWLGPRSFDESIRFESQTRNAYCVERSDIGVCSTGGSPALRRRGSRLLKIYNWPFALHHHQLNWFYSVAVITSGSDPLSSTRPAWTVRATPVRFRVRPTMLLCIGISFCCRFGVSNNLWGIFWGIVGF
jgi:hypothetical protein